MNNIYKIIFTDDIDYESANQLEKLIALFIIVIKNIKNDAFINYMKDKTENYKMVFLSKIIKDLHKKKYLSYKNKYLKLKNTFYVNEK